MPTTQQQYKDLARQLVDVHGWTVEQLRGLGQRLKGWGAAKSIAALSKLVAAKVDGEQAELLLAAAWSDTTELRRAICDAKRKPVQWTRPQRQRPSVDATIAATEALYAQARMGGRSPSHDEISELARRYDQRQDEAGVNNDCDGDNCPAPNKSQKLAKARQAQQAAHNKQAAGRRLVTITFNEFGTSARVPSRRTGHAPHVVALKDGRAMDCTCEHNYFSRGRCDHMGAAEIAWRICEEQPELVTQAQVQLDGARHHQARARMQHQLGDSTPNAPTADGAAQTSGASASHIHSTRPCRPTHRSTTGYRSAPPAASTTLAA